MRSYIVKEKHIGSAVSVILFPYNKDNPIKTAFLLCTIFRAYVDQMSLIDSRGVVVQVLSMSPLNFKLQCNMLNRLGYQHPSDNQLFDWTTIVWEVPTVHGN